MENDSIISELIHIMTAEAAANLRFPILHPIETEYGLAARQKLVQTSQDLD